MVKEERLFYRRNLYIFLNNHGPFTTSLYKIKWASSPYCVCGELTTSLYYVLQCFIYTNHGTHKPFPVIAGSRKLKRSTLSGENNTNREEHPSCIRKYSIASTPDELLMEICTSLQVSPTDYIRKQMYKYYNINQRRVRMCVFSNIKYLSELNLNNIT